MHDRLLTAISGNQGMAFRRILSGLGPPDSHIVLQLPPLTPNQGWQLSYVANSYRLNGFEIAVSVAHATEALELLTQIQPAAFKVDARELGDIDAVRERLEFAQHSGIQVVFKRVGRQAVLA